MEDDEIKPHLPLVPSNLAPNTIKLSDLLDFAVQQVFHELTVLSELLPKKHQDERKVSIVQFAHNVRMLFVKLLALVRWVKTSKRFEQCTAISYFLEQQSALLLESADHLFKIREEMTCARLPAFQITEAIDTLTTGSYHKLPLQIKEAFITKKKLKENEQAMVLGRLHQIVKTRVSKESSKLSPRIKEIRFTNGYITLVVPGEFEVQLTLLSAKSEQPWSLLNIKMLVEDYEIGFGSNLAHPTQLHIVHTQLQARLVYWEKDPNESQLNRLYRFLHRFAQSIQLDVLWCQTTQLAGMGGQYAGNISIERYDPKERILIIGYWMKHKPVRAGSSQIRITPEYRVTIMGTEEDGPLKVVHSPAHKNLGGIDDRTGRLSIDRLLSETFVVRAKERLQRIKKRIEAAEPKIAIAFQGQAVPFLRMPLLRDSITISHECLSISVFLQSGNVACDLDALSKSGRKELRDLEVMLYDDFKPVDVLRKQLAKIKILLMMERYKSAISSLQVRVVSEAQMAPFYKKVDSLPADRLCLQFIKEEGYFVIVTFDPSLELSIKLGLYLLVVNDEKHQLLELSEVPFVFDSLKRVIQLEALTYASGADYQTLIQQQRKLSSMEKQLIYAIAHVDDRLGIMRAKNDLEKRGIHLSLSTEDAESHIGGLVGDLSDLSEIAEIRSKDFPKHVARCALRLDNRVRGSWQMECTMGTPPLFKERKNGGAPKRCTNIVDIKSTIGEGGIAPTVIERLVTYGNIYEIVKKFSKAYEKYYVHFCTILAFTYHKLVLAYGEKRDMLLFLTFQPSARQMSTSENFQFKLAFGHTYPIKKGDNNPMGNAETKMNPHSLAAMAQELNKMWDYLLVEIIPFRFNRNHDLVDLVNHLITTLKPMYLIHNFYRTRFVSIKPYCVAMGLDAQFPLILKGSINILNRTAIRLTHGDIHLEIMLLMDDKVAIRDASKGTPKAAGLFEILVFLSDTQTTYLMEDEAEDNTNIQNSHFIPNPQSVGNSLQVPTPGKDGNSPRVDQRSPAAAPLNLTQLKPTRRLIITTHQHLAKLMNWTPMEDKPNLMQSYLDTHFNNLGFIKRIGTIMEHFKAGGGVQALSNGAQIREVYSGVDHVKVEFPSLGSNPCTVSLHLFLDPHTFVIRVKLSYSNDEPPEDNLIQLEEYVQKRILETYNEVTICSLIMFLRLTPYQTINSLIPYLQMDPTSPNRIMFPTVLRVGGSADFKYNPGLLIQDPSNVIIMVVFKSTIAPTTRKRITYNPESNTIKIISVVGPTGLDDALAEQINQEAASSGASAVYLLIKDSYQKICNTTPGSLQPSSVATSGSLNPGSNATYV